MGNKRQAGAVSLFAVIFAILLLTVLTVGFIKLMAQGQQRATENDLSQSAYDAALAGVEDAKRTIRQCQEQGEDSVACKALNNVDKQNDCQVISRARGLGDQPEILIQSSGEGNDFDQAYTCVNIDMDTEDYLFSSMEGKTELIPLKANGSVNKIIVSWYNQEDVGAGNSVQKPDASDTADTSKLPKKSQWNTSAPALLRVQLITPGTSFHLSDLDKGTASQTAFLRPAVISDDETNMDVSLDPAIHSRPVDSDTLSNKLTTMGCSSNFANDGYSCKATLLLGRTLSQAETTKAFLRINTIYKGSTVRVQLMNGSSQVMFRGAQPKVDSTGRANSLFRRVEARLKVGDDFPYPGYAVDIENALCKDFSVGSSAISGSCKP